MTRRSQVAVALIYSLLAPPSGAAELGNAFISRVVGPLSPQGSSFACFSRHYDDAHLAAHPRQRVTFAMALVHAYFRTSPLTAAGTYMYQVSLAFRFRNRPETLTQVAECGDGKPRDSLHGGASCAGPGDGPSHLAVEGADLLVLSIPGGADLWMPGPIDKRHEIAREPVWARRCDISFGANGRARMRGSRFR